MADIQNMKEEEFVRFLREGRKIYASSNTPKVLNPEELGFLTSLVGLYFNNNYEEKMKEFSNDDSLFAKDKLEKNFTILKVFKLNMY